MDMCQFLVDPAPKCGIEYFYVDGKFHLGLRTIIIGIIVSQHC